MSVDQLPKFDEFMVPILRLLADGVEHTKAEIVDKMIKQFNITEEQRSLLLPNSGLSYVYVRISWALSYLLHAGLITRKQRATYVISEKGKEEINLIPEKISWKYLRKFPLFNQFSHHATNGENNGIKAKNNTATEQTNNKEYLEPPEETIEKILKIQNNNLKEDLLAKIRTLNPAAFEKLVIDVVLALGYGKDREEMARVLGKTGDGGIDGEISQDKLGFDKIYLQAKKWGENQTVGAREIRDFIGALTLKHAKKGIFITTAKFTTDAIQTALNDPDHKVVLIDGDGLVKLMIEYEVGVRKIATYYIKKLDEDYFETL